MKYSTSSQTLLLVITIITILAAVMCAGEDEKAVTHEVEAFIKDIKEDQEIVFIKTFFPELEHLPDFQSDSQSDESPTHRSRGDIARQNSAEHLETLSKIISVKELSMLGSPIISGDQARVHLEAQIEIGGAVTTRQLKLHLQKDNSGIWRILATPQ